MFKGILVVLLSQLSGIYFFMFYCVRAFNETKYNGQEIFTIMIITSILFVWPSIVLNEKFTRKFNFLTGIFIQFTSCLVLAISKHIEIGQVASCCIVFYMMGYWIGFGGTTFLYISETLPPIGAKFCFVCHWISLSLIALFSLSLVKITGMEFLLWFISGVCFFSFLLVFLVLNETKGCYMDDVEDQLSECSTDSF